jgi:hypothetical protein
MLADNLLQLVRLFSALSRIYLSSLGPFSQPSPPGTVGRTAGAINHISEIKHLATRISLVEISCLQSY